MSIIETIKAEIERRIKEDYSSGDERDETAQGVCASILSFLDTLQEQPVCEGLEEEFRAYCYDFKNPETGEELVEDECSMDMEQARMLVRHFAQWGAEHLRPADGKKWIYEDEYKKDLERLFNDGKQAMKEQMMKEAVETWMLEGSMFEPEFIKRKVIIIKEDKQ